MYVFLLTQWILRKVDETGLQNAVIKKYISESECDLIVAQQQIAK